MDSNAAQPPQSVKILMWFQRRTTSSETTSMPEFAKKFGFINEQDAHQAFISPITSTELKRGLKILQEQCTIDNTSTPTAEDSPRLAEENSIPVPSATAVEESLSEKERSSVDNAKHEDCEEHISETGGEWNLRSVYTYSKDDCKFGRSALESMTKREALPEPIIDDAAVAQVFRDCSLPEEAFVVNNLAPILHATLNTDKAFSLHLYVQPEH
ncbi:MAG: hypothetical protein J3Q66DRAFT_415914 [Benniella sp.]|nr:MAG: hypothetical protein J3Q66DRAFT_415914 [Benniella sp.]